MLVRITFCKENDKRYKLTLHHVLFMNDEKLSDQIVYFNTHVEIRSFSETIRK